MTLTQEELDDIARSPESVSTDEGTVRERDAREVIALDRLADNKAATPRPLHGLRISRFKPGSAV